MTTKHPQIAIYERELIAHFEPQYIQIDDDSHHHAGHSGHSSEGASHLRLTIVSEKFAGLSRVQRHRLVYDTLGVWMKNNIHALVINAKTPSENEKN
jgi:BolA family transcriptional regulator, general stress-responsive regulator